MRILEVGPNVKQVSEVKLGDELELRIDVNRPYSKHTFANRHRRRWCGVANRVVFVPP